MNADGAHMQTEKGLRWFGMPDREKIINVFDRCCHAIPCNDCDWDACHKFKLPPPRMHIPLDLCLAVLTMLKEQETQIEKLEYDLAITKDNLNFYINGND